MLVLHTRPREVAARFVRAGDEVAMLQPAAADPMTQVRAAETARAGVGVVWMTVVAPPALVRHDDKHADPWGTFRLVIAPRAAGGTFGPALELHPTEDQQLVIRERVEVDGWAAPVDPGDDGEPVAAMMRGTVYPSAAAEGQQAVPAGITAERDQQPAHAGATTKD